MFKFILNRFYPDAPAPYSQREAVQHVIIDALVGHLYRLGYSVDEVRVPASLVSCEPPTKPVFVSSWGQFDLTPGLDAFGDNVITSALTGSNATTGTTASASVQADTVSTCSDDDLVKLIGDTLFDAIEEHAAFVYGYRITGHESMLGPKDEIGIDDGEMKIEPLARAVLGKLRSAGVIR